MRRPPLALPVDGGAGGRDRAGPTFDGAGDNESRRARRSGLWRRTSIARPSPLSRRLPRCAPRRSRRCSRRLPRRSGAREVITWKSTDGRAVEGLLTYPVGYQAGTRVPLLLMIHGGPAGVFMRSFIGAAAPYPIASFAARGYAVLRVNPRGSSGYGRTSATPTAGLGRRRLPDLMTGVDHVDRHGRRRPRSRSA